MKHKSIPTKAELLRQKAEEKLKKQQSKASAISSEQDLRKLYHELQVHQIELEIQNEELILAKEKAEESELNFKLLFEQNSTAIAISDPDTTISIVNNEFCKLSGYARKELIGSSWKKLILPEDLERFKEYNRARQTDSINVINKYEFRFINKNGEIRHALMSISKLEDNRIIVSWLDITDRKIAEEELKEKEKKLVKLNADKNLFMTILGHDLRGPISSLLGLSEVLVNNVSKYDINKTEKLASSIYNSAQHTFNLLIDLLNWAKAEQGNIPFEPQSLILKDLCDNTLLYLKETAEPKYITINCLVKNTMNVFADKNMLKTIMVNLVSNAIKFTNKGGSVNITAMQNPENVTIRVKDNGIGIPTENLEKLFNIAELLTTKGTNGESGTGLGLFLCKEFVEKHGGEIWAESEEGKGSEIIFTLPSK